MMRIAAVVFVLFAVAVPAQRPSAGGKAAPEFRRGLPKDADWFPLAVWLQGPHNAGRYRELGINLYVGLYEGPTQQELDALARAKMPVICAQNAVGLANKDNPIIVGWMHGDEPDNAQEKPGGGYGPPIEPQQIIADYRRLQQQDPSRPVWLNLGQGVAWDDWIGRGVRTNHPEDYAEYVGGCDIVSFDIYPVTHDRPAVAGKLEFVGKGVQRLRQCSNGKPVWACIEASHIGNKEALPTPEQLRSEVWMAIANGASGIVYFVHEFAPKFVEAGVFEHPELAAAIKQVNAEVLQYAAVLHEPEAPKAARVDGDVALACKQHQGSLYLFAVSMSGKPLTATFTVAGRAKAEVQVDGEKRRIALSGGRFRDDFAPYAVHLYRLPK